MKADRVGEGELDIGKIKRLKYYMKSMQSVIFHEDRFDAIMRNDQSIKNLIGDDMPKSDKLFELKVADVARGKVKMARRRSNYRLDQIKNIYFSGIF